jgi:hypothetical protein
MIKKTTLFSILLPWFLLFAALPARAVNISTHSFAGCGFPDTGQKTCYDATGLIPCPAPGAALAQDGTYGSGVGQPSYTENKVSGVLVTVDNRTGLMWITNPADAGMDATYTWPLALAACEASTFAGYSDWRLPNARELMSIVDYSKSVGPTLNAAFFPNTHSNYYWTSTSYAPDPTLAWYVDFSAGYVHLDTKTNNASYARCVRGGAL